MTGNIIKFQLRTILMCTTFMCATAQAVEVGGIKGQINFCGKGGVDGMVVYVPGRQHTVITDATGQFEFESMATGIYNFHYHFGGKHIASSNDIWINNNTVTDLRTVEFCDDAVKITQPGVPATTSAPEINKSGGGDVDKDHDGSFEGQDCNDTDPTIRPGAIEICDGKDNNCNGSIDESSVYVIRNGIGKCEAGVVKVDQCTEGYADCDGDSTNGCEINLNNDAENCGACGNMCSSMDTCGEGLC